ncbi:MULTISPECIES: hypothetical protein [Mesonia]|uniref:Uncharacterized protein n=1 Tax=Mesonia oceanica TaxID=2687242 RepID=A0AC61YDM4_9FLAO|nr:MULTISPECIES: hypothetical protein [Mesonia]MAN28066.1 hypothetical protein [Mesonia sp.]MAQ39762.1 hypothetical protein [Mesonia sp.]MBJ96579.1 hypothetical protein [Flavobacteriaceae bacterium]VVV02523.1 hypothetical protein FVB9532_03823 [Mesonia oceanica]|tara:strand:- start:183 stop:701 length:519 start_codon:yes stop_codon:yes gene_type:complete
MINLEEIKEYFGKECKTFPKLNKTDAKLSVTSKEILYEIGLPTYSGYGGDYIMLDELQLLEKRYLKFATRDFDEEYYSRCIDLKTDTVVFNLSYDGNKEYHFLNSDLESYLRYVYIYIKYMEEIETPEKLGNYHENYSKYAKELKERLLTINQDVNQGSWADLIEEMDLGVI